MTSIAFLLLGLWMGKSAGFSFPFHPSRNLHATGFVDGPTRRLQPLHQQPQTYADMLVNKDREEEKAEEEEEAASAGVQTMLLESFAPSSDDEEQLTLDEENMRLAIQMAQSGYVFFETLMISSRFFVVLTRRHCVLVVVPMVRLQPFLIQRPEPYSCRVQARFWARDDPIIAPMRLEPLLQMLD